MADGKRLRIVIVDDEEPARRRLRDVLADCAAEMAIDVVGEAANGRAALDLLSAQPADVVLLDIRMPEMDGIELAQHLRHLENPPAIVFTTAYDAYALRAFEVHAIDYLLKPIRASRVREALARVLAVPRPASDVLQDLQPEPRAFLSAAERGRIHLVPIGDVLFLRAEQKYVTARTAEREYLLEESLTRLEQEYAERFVRVPRSCLVAKAAIRSFEREPGAGSETHWVVTFKACDDRIPVSRRQQHVIRDLAG
jgi:two-component system, LytTR family, response regulator AlgR